MPHAEGSAAWRDRVAAGDAPLGRDADHDADTQFADAVALAGVAFECAVRPVLALAAEVRSILYFEIREHAQRRAARTPRA